MESTLVHADALSIALSEIAIPAGARKPDAGAVADLMDSIKKDGLLQPIGVRRSEAGSAGPPFRLVFGGHRLEAFSRLGYPDIPGRLLEVTDEQAESATLAENLYRNPLIPAAFQKAMKRWQEMYEIEYPETVGNAARSRATKKQRAPAADPGVLRHNTPAQEDEAERFDVAAAKKLGISPEKVRKATAANKVLSDSDLDILEDRKVGATDLNRIVALKDPEKRAQVIALVASGMLTSDAMTVAKAPTNATVEHVEDANPGQALEDELPDGEWLERYCHTALGRIPFQDVFRRDAVIWRHCRKALHDFRKATKKELARSRHLAMGPFQFRAGSITNICHPNDWTPCAPCAGTANAGGVTPCVHCHGSGYLLRTSKAR